MKEKIEKVFWFAEHPDDENIYTPEFKGLSASQCDACTHHADLIIEGLRALVLLLGRLPCHAQDSDYTEKFFEFNDLVKELVDYTDMRLIPDFINLEIDWDQL